ncbi:MAG: ATP-binding protein [Alphaproteobacteria bacterium]
MDGYAYTITMTASADPVVHRTAHAPAPDEPQADRPADARLGVSHLPHAAALLSPSGVVLDHNRAFHALLSASLEPQNDVRLHGTALTEALTAADVSRLRLGLAFVEAGDPAQDARLSFALKLRPGGTEGAQIWLEARPVDTTHWLAHLYPDHPVLSHGLAAHGGDGAALITTDGRIRALTAASARFLAADPIHLVDEPFTNLAAPQDRAALHEAMAMALAHPSEARETPLVTFTLCWGGTERACLATRLVPLARYNGGHGGYDGGAIALLRDMAGLKALEGERDTAIQSAEQASQTKSRFLAGMSHELRTPLNAIIGFSDILQQEMFGPLGNERYQEYIGLIRDSGLAMLQLVTDILDLARIETGRYALRVEPVNTGQLITAEMEKWRKRAALKEVAVDAALPPVPPVLHADRLALSQILTNLMSNAVKYTDSGGRVTVAAEELGDAVNIVVMDTGAGIQPDLLPKLGRPFEQMVAETSNTGAGNGIGLALVHALAKLHQGTVTIDSTVGEGTIVTVRLPREVSRPQEDQSGDGSPGEDGTPAAQGPGSAAA